MKNLVKFLLIFLFLSSVVGLKYYFFLNPSRNFFLLSYSDIMLKAPELLKKPTPLPYVESFIEYPVLTGIWVTFLAHFSNQARDFFYANGIFLSFFSSVSIFLARETAEKFLEKKVSLLKFLTPSVVFFTFFNWDALAVFLLLSSLYLLTVSASRARFWWGTFLATLGVWTKLFPIFVFPSLFLRLVKEKRMLQLVFLFLLFVVVSLLLNAPFYLSNFKGWSHFFSFSASRPANIDSVWSGLYVISDKVFGPGFALKRYYDTLVNYASYSLLVFFAVFYFLKKLVEKKELNLFLDATFLIALFLLVSKVYSPQYNLWLVPLFLILGLSYRKILLFEFINLLVTWAVFQYFWYVSIAGKSLLPFPYFKLFYLLSLMRHAVLFLLTVDVYRLSFNRGKGTRGQQKFKLYEKNS